jgi:uncharacterized membrane protein YkvA (DUF1232 family)
MQLPDLIPIVGYTDDLGVHTLALTTVLVHINDAKDKIRSKEQQWVGIILDRN